MAKTTEIRDAAWHLLDMWEHMHGRTPQEQYERRSLLILSYFLEHLSAAEIVEMFRLAHSRGKGIEYAIGCLKQRRDDQAFVTRPAAVTPATTTDMFSQATGNAAPMRTTSVYKSNIH